MSDLIKMLREDVPDFDTDALVRYLRSLGLPYFDKAADRIEAQDKRIAELGDDIGAICAGRDFVFAEKNKRIAELEAALAAAREQCAKVADGLTTERGNADYQDGWEWAQVNIAAAIRAGEPAQNAWRTIESAPRDETAFVAIWLWKGAGRLEGSESHQIVRWNRRGQCWDTDGGLAPTHWAPIPPL